MGTEIAQPRDLEPHLLAYLARQGVLCAFASIHEPARQPEPALPRVFGAPDEERITIRPHENRGDGAGRVEIQREAARPAAKRTADVGPFGIGLPRSAPGAVGKMRQRRCHGTKNTEDTKDEETFKPVWLQAPGSGLQGLS